MNISPGGGVGASPRSRRRVITVVAVVAAVVVLVVAVLAGRALLGGSDDGGRAAPPTLLSGPSATALTELAGNRLGAASGAVVALDPATGAVLVAVSTPDTGSGPPAGLDERARALANGAFARLSPPGSVFHLVVTATALAGGLTPETPLQAGERYTPPGQQFQIRNPTAGCADRVTLQQAVVQSCHTAFARFCVEQGTGPLAGTARAFGFEAAPPFTDGSGLRSVTSTTGPLETLDPVAVAQTCVGSREVRMSPLLGSLVAASVVNDGRVPRPYVARSAKTGELGRPLAGPAAAQLRTMMVASVTDGFAKNARIPGLEVGGRSGGGLDRDEDGWFIGFAVRDGRPLVAIAVLLDKAGRGGGTEAARIAGQIMRSIAGER